VTTSTSLTRAIRDRAPELLAAAFGVSWFLALGGAAALPPSNVDWLTGDQRGQLMSWLFFRRSGWSLPLGRIDGLAWPVGTTVGFTDGNPLVSIALKPFSFLLPDRFQFLGPWLAVCFALQGWFGARIAATASAAPAFRFFGGALYALSPPLVARLGHTTLCAHFGILAALELNLRDIRDARAARRALTTALVVTCAMGAVHPVLATMVLALALAIPMRLSREGVLSRKQAWSWAGRIVLAEALVWLTLGYFTSAPSHGWGFGHYSADLLTLVNSMGFSRVLPALPHAPPQWEGFGYLGLGAIALALVAAVATARRRWSRSPSAGEDPLGGPRRRALHVTVIVLAMFVFALSQVITVGGRPLLDLTTPYKPLYPLAGPFRSSGRFVWPLVYLIYAGGLWAAGRFLEERAAVVTVAAVAAIQLLDLSGLAMTMFRPHDWVLRAPEWQLASGHYDHLAMYPPQVIGGGKPCEAQAYGPDFHAAEPYALLAYDLGMTVNSGFLSRASARKHVPACRALEASVRGGALDPRTVYVVHPTALADFEHAHAVCGRVEGRDVCVSRDSQRTGFRELLERTAAR
jgi:hypothetical protein